MLNTFSPPHHISHCCFNTHPISLLHSSHHHLHLHHHHHHHHHHHRHRPYNSRIHQPHFSTGVFYSLSAIDNKHHHQNQEQDEDPDDDQEQYQEQEQDQDQDTPFFNPVYNSPPIYLNEIKQDSDTERGDFGSGIFTNMWWADLKAALGQRVNVEGLMFSVSVITRNKHWVIPHVSVPDVRYIDWAALKRKGFEGVVFDKDNTLTVPYSLALWGPLAPSVESCKSVFGNNIAVFSNSAGLLEYDPDGRKARALEFVIGIRVIRHKVKKPAGSAEEIERHFGCDSSKLIMVGDRPFTDIVYGNRNGFLTILTAPLSLAEEPFIVKQVRKIELALVKRWLKKGLKPANDRLLQDALDCVKEPPSI